MMLIETFVARYNGYVWYFRYCGVGKLLPRVANHLRGCWAWGVLPRGCSRVIPKGFVIGPQTRPNNANGAAEA
jgi:hypothetical protein